jgi:hypothetical protein
VEGKELGVLEGLEAVDDQGLGEREWPEAVAVEEEAVAAGPGQVPGDGGMVDLEEASDLAEGGSVDRELGDTGEEAAVA